MEWLKDRPVLQWMLNAFTTILAVLLMFWLTGWSSSNEKEEARFRRLEQEKADYGYVDQNCMEITNKLEEHAAYDKMQDVKIETMRKEWRQDQKEILELIRGL